MYLLTLTAMSPRFRQRDASVKFKLHSKLFSLIVAALPAVVLAGSAVSSGKEGFAHCSTLTAASTTRFSAPNIHVVDVIPCHAMPAIPMRPVLTLRCEISGLMNERLGTDGHLCTNKLDPHMTLNAEWNGKKIFIDSGGSSGGLGDVLTVGMLPYSPRRDGHEIVLMGSERGSAAITHIERNAISPFNFDQQASTDQVCNFYPRVTLAANELLAAFEDTKPPKSHLIGCSVSCVTP